MKTSIIAKFAGLYDNPDVYDCVITYVSQKDYIGGYALFYPLSSDSVIRQYCSAEENSLHDIDHKIWHFSVSVNEVLSHRKLLLLADKIAALFAPHYQVYYSLELKPGQYHLHFAVNAYSYLPMAAPLIEPLFDQHLETIKSIILLQEFPDHIPQIVSKEATHV